MWKTFHTQQQQPCALCFCHVALLWVYSVKLNEPLGLQIHITPAAGLSFRRLISAAVSESYICHMWTKLYLFMSLMPVGSRDTYARRPDYEGATQKKRWNYHWLILETQLHGDMQFLYARHTASVFKLLLIWKIKLLSNPFFLVDTFKEWFQPHVNDILLLFQCFDTRTNTQILYVVCSNCLFLPTWKRSSNTATRGKTWEGLKQMSAIVATTDTLKKSF